ncbi:hypothetical protein TcCL_Unassigned01551 [Trypanosoma cruzi]|nr:hypothetical protein TcCL_Unassigned01551 [Trypanosoma cruzi]
MAARQRGHPRQKLPLATPSNVPCGPHDNSPHHARPSPTHAHHRQRVAVRNNKYGKKSLHATHSRNIGAAHTTPKTKKQRGSEPTRTPPHARHRASPIICVVQPRQQQRIQGHTQPLPSPLPETQSEEYTAARTRHKRASRAAAMRSVPIHSPLLCVGKRLRP